jgi:hypothetical protein
MAEYCTSVSVLELCQRQGCGEGTGECRQVLRGLLLQLRPGRDGAASSISDAQGGSAQCDLVLGAHRSSEEAGAVSP